MPMVGRYASFGFPKKLKQRNGLYTLPSGTYCILVASLLATPLRPVVGDPRSARRTPINGALIITGARQGLQVAFARCA